MEVVLGGNQHVCVVVCTTACNRTNVDINIRCRVKVPTTSWAKCSLYAIGAF